MRVVIEEIEGLDLILLMYLLERFEFGNKDDVSKFQNGRQFDFVDSMNNNNGASEKHDRLFNDFIDDPLLANDPRVNRDPKKDLAAMMESRGYASGSK